MSDRDRDVDPVVSRALHDLPVPEHGPDFWAKLDDRLARSRLAAPDHAYRDETPPNEVISLVEARQRRDLSRRWMVAAAAAVLAIALGVVLRPGGDDTVETADPGPDTTAPPNTTTGDTAPFGGDAADAEAAVTSWLTAVGNGDIDTARDLTGPRTVAYIESLGGTIDGFLQEASEGWGAWPASPDIQIDSHELGEVDGTTIAIVVVQGTWTGEGDTYHRTDAIPVVVENGQWLVEINAFRPDVGGRIEFISPEPTDGGLSGPVPDGLVEAVAPGDGTFCVQWDDLEVQCGLGTPSGDGVQLSHQQAGLASGAHLLVVAYVDGDTITAFAGQVSIDD